MSDQATVTAEHVERVFVYNSQSGRQTWGDPGPGFSVDDVRQELATIYPELAKATAKETKLPDGRLQVEFIKKAGTKGHMEEVTG